MRRILTLCGVLVFCSSSAALAQTPTATPSSKLGFDQPAPDTATAQSYTYRTYFDGATVGTVVVATCVAGATTTAAACTVPLPPLSAGQHSVQITAADIAGESVKSDPFVYVFVVAPGKPTNVHIVP